MFRSLRRSWQFAKMSYEFIGTHKKLIFFPIFSTIAAILVLVSFVVPLWQTGTLVEWAAFLDEETQVTDGSTMMYVTAFLFYFTNYFVIVFFNTALLACVFNVMNGNECKLSYGIGFAFKRFPQILGWALVSAVIGVLLKMIENANEKLGRLVALILGSAWTALTYFVAPVIVIEGFGPIGAFKRSAKTMKETWGTALIGGFSLNWIGFLLALPVIILFVFLFGYAFKQGSAELIAAVSASFLAAIVILAATSAAAASVFQAFLYTHATGRTLPAGIDTSNFDDAFRTRRKK